MSHGGDGASGHHGGGHGGYSGHGGSTELQAVVIGLGMGHNGHNNAHYSWTSTSPGPHFGRESSVHAVDRQGDPRARVLTPGVIPTVDPNGESVRAFLAHVTGHGRVDIEALVSELSRKLGLVDLSGLPNMNFINDVECQILDWNAWLRTTDGEKPAGWRPGATGTTRLIREYWQVGKRFGLFNTGPLERDPDERTYIQVSATEWWFEQSCQYETRLEFVVFSDSMYSSTFGKYGTLAKPFPAHQAAAIELATQVYNVLHSTSPTELDRCMAAIDAARYPNTGPKPTDGVSRVSRRQLLAEAWEALDEAGDEDELHWADASTSSPTLPTSPPEATEAEDGDDDDDDALVAPDDGQNRAFERGAAFLR